LALSAAEQIQAYGKWLAHYHYSEQTTKYGMKVGDQPPARQAAVLQAMQFAPNGTKWKVEFARGNYSVPSTSSKQAHFLGDTSIHDMEAYYGAFLKQHPPSYAGEEHRAPMAVREALAAEPQIQSSTNDGQFIPDLLKLASDPNQLVAAQQVAAKRLLDFDGEIFPSDGCAITLSVLLQEVGIAVPDIFQAIKLGEVLKVKRRWQIIPIGQQMPGDVGSTCGSTPHHGTDHIYLVLKLINSDEMVVADNQAQAPHFRWASGKGGKSPTTFFLRAPK